MVTAPAAMAHATGCLYERLYRDHHAWLAGWLSGRLGCSQDAADLAHDTFLRLLGRRSEGSGRPLREPRAYLRSVAGGLLVDHYRRRSLERAYLEALAALPEPVAVSPEEREIILETLDRIDAMLDRLPEAVRRAFLLSQLHGRGYAEVAAELGVSVRTVKRYMQRAFTQCLAMML